MSADGGEPSPAALAAEELATLLSPEAGLSEARRPASQTW